VRRGGRKTENIKSNKRDGDQGKGTAKKERKKRKKERKKRKKERKKEKKERGKT
jgi:hypothetical protein